MTYSTGDAIGMSTWHLVFYSIFNFKGKFLHVDKMLVADITIIIIRKVCCFRKMEKYLC